jgi:hypothetical protein
MRSESSGEARRASTEDVRDGGDGIVNVGTERRVLDADGSEHDMLNPNVLIDRRSEALYHRNFLLLVKKRTTLPSNLLGLYEVRYQGDGLDHEATMNLLKAFDSFKDAPSTAEDVA